MGILTTTATIILRLTGLWAVSSPYFILRNYSKAARIGLPIRVIPISHINLFWMLVDLTVIGLVKRLLPFVGDSSFAPYNFRAFELEDRYRSHQQMGDAFILVTPGRNWLYLANPETLMNSPAALSLRVGDFPQSRRLVLHYEVGGG